MMRVASLPPDTVDPRVLRVMLHTRLERGGVV